MPLSHVYLQDDHLEWWSARPPGPGPVGTAGRSKYRAFFEEFFANVAWVAGDAVGDNDLLDPITPVDAEGNVVGGGVRAQFNVMPMRRFDWRNVPNAVQPAADFKVRAAVVDGTPPRFANIRFRGDRDPQRRVIESNDRTSIWIDFVQPMRAVGLQCGFIGGPDRGLNQDNFKLEAWRSDGSLAAVSTGSDLAGAADWQPYLLELIAVRDDRAAIRTVRLSCVDPGFELNERLFLYRVWFETLPVAFVKQGTIINVPLETFRGHQHRAHIDLPPQMGVGADPLQRSGDPVVSTAPTQEMASGMIGHGAITLELPVDCDRAEVFVRGFKFIPGVGGARRREPYIQKFSQLGFQLNTAQYPTAQNRRISFSLDGQYHWGEEDEERVDALLAVYWTVVAWRSDRADLYAIPMAENTANHPRKAKALFSAPHQRPLADAAALAAAGPAAIYGGLFGGQTRYRLTLPRPVEPQTYFWGLGTMGAQFPPDEYFDDEARTLWEYIIGGLASTGSAGLLGGIAITKWVADYIGEHGRLQPVAVLPAPLRYSADGQRIEWGWVTSLEETLDTDERASTWFGGTVLMGRSLVLDALDQNDPGDDRFVRTVTGEVIQREANETPFPSYVFNVPLGAEQVMVVLQAFNFKPEDEVRELDVEVRAARFDGTILRVAGGAGVEITEQPQGRVDEPSVSVSADGGFSSRKRLAFGFPNIVGIKRIETATRTVFTTRDAQFDWVDGTRDDLPKVTGYLRNDGNIPVGVRSVRIEGVHAPAFDLKFTYRGVTKFFNLFAAGLPLTLMPGERIEVIGSFAPAGVPAVIVGMAATARVMFALTNGDPELGVDARAVRGNLQPGGFFFPPNRTFGQVRVVGLQVIAPAPGTIGTVTVRPPVPASAVKRVFALMNYGADALVVRALTLDPPVAGLSFRITKHPVNLGQLRPAGNTRHVLEPGTSLDCELTWAPPRAGPIRTRLVADTNQGVLAMEISGEAIP